MSDNVIEFKTTPFQVRETTSTQKRCGHSSMLVDEQTQMIECCHCGLLMNAYQYVLSLAKNEVRYSNQVKYLKLEASQIAGEITELKRQRTNLKAQVRRSTNKDHHE